MNTLSTIVPNVISQYSLYSSSYSYNGNPSILSSIWSGMSIYFLLYTCTLLLLAFIAYYIYSGIVLMQMAERLGFENEKILAWIPILNTYLLVLIAKKNIVWFFLSIFFPILRLYFYYLIFKERYGKNTRYFVIWGLTRYMAYPISLYMLWQLANEEPSV